MTNESHTTVCADDDNSTDCLNKTVAPQKFAELFERHGRLRLVSDPRGEWIDCAADAAMEVRR